MASINPFLPIQEGTGTPSPENVRPIYPAVSIAGGKNLYNSATNTTNSYIRANNPVGEIIPASGYNVTDYIAVKPGTVYTINYNSITTATAAGMVYFSTKSVNDIVGSIALYYQTYSNNKKYYTFTTPNNCHYIRFSTFPQTYDIQLEEGSEPTEYEPYQSLDIYGGYLDIANSRIVEEWNYVEYDGSESWTKGTDGSAKDFMMKIALPTSASFSVSNLLSNYLQTIAANARWGNYDSWISWTVSYTINTGIQFITTVEDWQSYLALHNLQVVYKLRDSITHYLSPTQLAQAMEQLGIKLSSTLIDVRRKIILNSPHLETASGSIANFSTDMKAPLKECKIHFLPVQSGSGDPSPDNIRPITGWTGVNVTIRQALWDGKYEQGILNNNGEEVSATNRYRSTEYISVVPGSKLTFKYNAIPISAANIFLCQYDMNKVFKKAYWQNNGPCNLNSLTYYIRFFMDTAFSDNYVNGNLAITNYLDPYYQFSVSFGDNGTIYGGYVDLVTGELVAEWSSVLGSSLGWFKGSVYPYFATNKLNPGNSSLPGIAWPDVSIMCESYRTFPSRNNTDGFYDDVSNYTVWQHGNVSGSVRQIRVKDTRYETLEDFNTAIANVRFVYKLETPITYQLTPQQLKSLKGINNIWSDANDITEVKFWKH